MKMPCPKCKKPGLRQQVSVYVDAPTEFHSLGKKYLIKRNVKILGVGWPYSTWYCPQPRCGFLQHLAPHIKDGRLDFVPGARVILHGSGKTGTVKRSVVTKYITCWVDLDGGGRQRVTTQHLTILPTKDKKP
jgi:hypothetical protein